MKTLELAKNKSETKFGEPKKIGEILSQMAEVENKLDKVFSQPDKINTSLVKRYGVDRLRDLYMTIDDFFSRINPSPLLGRVPLEVNSLHEQDVRDFLDKETHDNPDLERAYLGVLREIKKDAGVKIEGILNGAKSKVEVDPEFRTQLDRMTVNLDRPIDKGEVDVIHKEFPSGNYLLHTVSVDNAVQIIQSGAILTASEISRMRNTNWGRGGKNGISFNMNDVRVLTGDPAHFMGFLVAPETILNDNTNLKIPAHSGAKFEVQYSPNNPNSALPRISVEKAFIFVNSKDVDSIKDILSGLRILPKGILVYPQSDLRTISWLDPIGDHEKAAELIDSMFSQAGLSPSIDWRSLFQRPPKIIGDTFVSIGEEIGSKEIVKKDGVLEIIAGRSQPRSLDRASGF